MCVDDCPGRGPLDSRGDRNQDTESGTLGRHSCTSAFGAWVTESRDRGTLVGSVYVGEHGVKGVTILVLLRRRLSPSPHSSLLRNEKDTTIVATDRVSRSFFTSDDGG